MAYDQYSSYQQPPRRQYYNQGPPQGQPPTGYNNQYDGYDGYDGYDSYDGYDQGQDGGWDNGYQQGYADPKQGAWQCPNCGHLYRFAHWKIQKGGKRALTNEQSIH